MTTINEPKLNWSLFAGAESIGPTTSSEEETSSLSDSSSSNEPIPTNSRKGDPWKPKMVGLPQDPNDWLWLMSEEPHRSRRRAILKDHPEASLLLNKVTKLMGFTTTTRWIVLLVVSLQVSISIYFAHLSNSGQQSAWNWRFFLTAYAIGGTANQNIFLAIHEITHNLAFKSILNNKLLALFANIPITIPYSMIFKKYHIEHHRYLGEDGVDTDLPTKFELLCLNNVFGKAFFATFQILFYALRPGFVKSQKPTRWVFANFALQLSFDYFLYRTFGLTAVMYLLLSSFFAGSLHPCAAHFIAEHYLWSVGGEQETWSYYGPLNMLTYNVGYHNEHHDFPSIPWTRLPKLKQIAHDYYDPLPSHSSWPLVTYNFIFKTDVGLFSRVKREAGVQHLKLIPEHDDSKKIKEL